MHDLKNLIAQQELVVKNAAKHKENPAFVEDAIDTIYLEDSIYFLGPGLGFESAYATFRDGLFGKYAICDFVKSGHDHRVVLRAFDKAIEMRYLRPHAEVRVPNDIPNYDDIPEVGNPKHAKMMTQLVSQMLSETFDATAIVDGHAINKQKMIRAKIAGGDVEFTPDAPVKAATSDLMAALTASIAKSKAKSPKAKTTPAIRRKGRKVA